MVNDPNLIKKIIAQINNLKFEEVDNAIKEVDKEWKLEFKELTDEQLIDYQEFQLCNNELNKKLLQRIEISGIIKPLIARPLEDDKYQILIGRNRRICGREVGIKKFPCIIIYGLTDDNARDLVINSNKSDSSLIKKEIKELTKEHLEKMFLIQEGATIFGLKEAILLREVEQYDKSLINIIDNKEELEKIVGNKNDLYDNKNPKTGHLAYFGAILTDKGKEWLDRECYNRGLHFM